MNADVNQPLSKRVGRFFGLSSACMVLLSQAPAALAEYYITLGSYKQKAVAERELAQLPAEHGPYIIFADTNRDDPFHFLLHGPFQNYRVAYKAYEQWAASVPDAWIQELDLPTQAVLDDAN